MALPREFLGTLFHPDDTSYPPDMSPALQDASKENNFDFIVIGLGAAGAAVAARFAHDNPQWSVLALESGTDPPIEAEVPGLWFRLWRDELLWMYPSEPRDDAFQGMQGKRTTMIRGKAIGGTSTVNGMPYLRGHPKDYDSWQIEGWSFKDVLPFFKRFEDMRDSRVLDLNPDYHGVGGEMTVEPAKSTDPLKSVIKAAAKELGYDEVIDMNGPGDLGFGDIHRTQRDGTRCGSAKAYLSKAAPGGGQLTNLTIGKCCTATKLVFDADQKRVTAVEFQAPLGGAPSMAYVTKEVILCAGAMETPKLLMLSGVGPKDHLQDLGIPVIEDLPVGETLQDHALFPGIIFTVPPVPAVGSDPLKAFVEEKSGPLSNVGLMELMGFIKTESTADWEVPSVQFNHVRYPKGCFQSMALAPEIEEAIKKINHDSDILVIMPFLLHPQKPGKLCLRSADAKDPPKFISGLLADPRDVEVMREGIAFVEKMAKTKSFQEAGIIMRYVEFPGSESMIPGSSSYWEHALRLLAGSAFHPVATCALGIVLDSQLRVKGVQNVRVADASAIPSPLSANPNAPAIMIGERAAQFLLEEYKDHPPVND